MKPDSSSLIRGWNTEVPREQPLLQTPTNRKVVKRVDVSWMEKKKEAGRKIKRESDREEDENEKTHRSRTVKDRIGRRY